MKKQNNTEYLHDSVSASFDGENIALQVNNNIVVYLNERTMEALMSYYNRLKGGKNEIV